MRDAIENLLHVESMLTLLSSQESNEDDGNTKHCIALARDVLSDATNDLKSPVEILITELRRRIEGPALSLPTGGWFVCVGNLDNI